MLTLDERTNQRFKTRQRNRQLIYSMGAIFGLLGILLGSGWLFIPNIVPLLAGSALLIGSPLTVFLFGLAGIALGLFVGKQAINLGRSLLHIINGEKSLRSWLRVGVALTTAAIMIPLVTTGTLPIAATGFAAVAIGAAIVTGSIALATMLAKHAARYYTTFTEAWEDTRGNFIKSLAHVFSVNAHTNPYKQTLSYKEITRLPQADVRKQIDNLSAYDIQRRLNEKVNIAKYYSDTKAEMEAKAARDLLHMAANEDNRTDLAGTYLAGVKEYVRRIDANEKIHSDILAGDVDDAIQKQAKQAFVESEQAGLVDAKVKDISKHLNEEKAVARLIRGAKGWLLGIYPKERSWLEGEQAKNSSEQDSDRNAFASLRVK